MPKHKNPNTPATRMKRKFKIPEKEQDLVTQIVEAKNAELEAAGSARRLSDAQKTAIAVYIKNMGNVSATRREL